MQHNNHTVHISNTSKRIIVSCNDRSIDDMTRAIILVGVPVTGIEPLVSSPGDLEVNLSVPEGAWLAAGGKDTYLASIQRRLDRLDRYCDTAAHIAKYGDIEAITSTEPYSVIYRTDRSEYHPLIEIMKGSWQTKDAWKSLGNGVFKFEPNAEAYQYRNMPKDNFLSPSTLVDLYDLNIDKSLKPLVLAMTGGEAEKIIDNYKVLVGIERIQHMLKVMMPRVQRATQPEEVTPQYKLGTLSYSPPGLPPEKMVYISLYGSENSDMQEKERLTTASAEYIKTELERQLRVSDRCCKIKAINKGEANQGVAVVVDKDGLRIAGGAALAELTAVAELAMKKAVPPDVTVANNTSDQVRSFSVITGDTDEPPQRRSVSHSPHRNNGFSHNGLSYAEKASSSRVEAPVNGKPRVG